MRRKVQVIGDRKVINPRIKTVQLLDHEGNVTDTVELSMETCGCGYSMARPGVEYRDSDGWLCKRCGQNHTMDRNTPLKDIPSPKPDAELMRKFDQRTAYRVAGTLTPEDVEQQAQHTG